MGIVASFMLLSWAVGCGDDSSTGGGGSGQGGQAQGGEAQGGGGDNQGGDNQGGDNQGGNGGSGGGAAGTASVRVAHLSPDAPAVDFCIIPEGGEPIGPVLEAVADIPEGLAYPGTTPYLDVPAGTYSVRITLANATNCDEGAVPDVDGITFAADSTYTAAAIGMLAPAGNDEAFALTLFEDDNTVETGKVRVRFIHASPDTPNVDVGLGSGNAFTPVWTDVAYSEIGLVGGEPYVSIAPPTNAQLSARATGTTTDALVLDGVTVPTDQVVTVFAIGNLDGNPAPLKALACLDLSGTCLTLPAD